MFTKTLVTAALTVLVFPLSGVAYAEGLVYQGGPKSTISTRAPSPTVEANKPYAQYVPAMRSGTNKHIYQGGPKSPIPHQQQ